MLNVTLVFQAASQEFLFGRSFPDLLIRHFTDVVVEIMLII